MIQGPARSVRVLTADELRQNGGRWELQSGPAIPVIGLDDDLNRALIDGPKLVVYPVTDAEIDTGVFELMAGPELPMYSLLENRAIIDGPAIPIRVISGTLGVVPFIPTDLAFLRLWLDANDISTLFQDILFTMPVIANGDIVAGWRDKSGNVNDVIQATVSKRGTYRTSVINGLPSVRLDGTDDLLVNASNFLTSSSGIIFAVYQLTAPVKITDQTVFSSADEATITRFVLVEGRRDTANPNLLIAQRDDDVPDEVEGDTIIVASTPYLVAWGSTGTEYRIRNSGVEETISVPSGANSGDWFSDTSDLDNVTVGALKITSEANFLLGDLSELLVYDPFPSAADITLVEQYLADKYGFVL